MRDSVGERAIRQELELYVRNYRSYTEDLKGQVGTPETKEQQYDRLRAFVSQYAKAPTKDIKTDDPLVAMLQAEFRKNPRISELSTHPRGSGFLAMVEQSRVPVVLEDVAGWAETSIVSAGVMMALRTVFPQVAVAHLLSIAIAIAISYGSNIPLKNRFLKRVMKNLDVMKAMAETVVENPIKTAVIFGSVGFAISPAFNSSVREGLTSQTVAAEVETKLKPAEDAFNAENPNFEHYVTRLDAQLNALTTAEWDTSTETMARLHQEFPGMTFGESGDGGKGNIYHGKRNIFFGEAAPSTTHLPADMLATIAEARHSAGLTGTQSLADNLREYHRQFEEQTRVRRARIVELFVTVHSVAGEMKKQDIPYLMLNSGVLGNAPVPPDTIEPARAELEHLLHAQGEDEKTFETEVQRRVNVLTAASTALHSGGSISLDLPESNAAQAFQDFMGVNLHPEHPLIKKFSQELAQIFDRDKLSGLTEHDREHLITADAPQYREVAKIMVEKPRSRLRNKCHVLPRVSTRPWFETSSEAPSRAAGLSCS